MTKLITIILLLFMAACAPSHQKNTTLQPIVLTGREIEVVLKEIERYESKYDSAVHLVWATQARHYHSDFQEETKIHSVRSSLGYAEALLNARKPEFRERAFDVLRAVIALQDQDAQSKTCGVWPYSLEEPLATKKTPADRNWADFSAVPIIGIINNHSDILPNDLKEKTQKALLLAAQAIRKRDVRPDYTNISLMGLYVCYMTADMYNDADLIYYARKRLKAFYDCTVLNKGFIEYNSPAYFKLSLDEVLRLKNHVINPDDLAMLEFIYHTGWSVIARHYHQPTAQWAGPHGRAYSVLLGSSTYNWLYTSSGGIVNPDTPTEFSRDEDPVLKHRIPADLIPYFTQPTLPRMEIDTFIRGGQKIELNPLVSYQESDRGVWIETKEVIGKSYFTRDFVLSSANQSCLWNQRRPLIAYWGTTQKPVSMQIRFLHDGYDYAAANIFCAQDSTNVLGTINFTTNGGDRHVTIDVIQNATIKATDLRLRFEFGGDISSVGFNAPEADKNRVVGKSGKLNFRIELPYQKFGDYQGNWSIGGNEKNKWIDFVIYSGTEKEFNFGKIQEAVLGFLFSLKAGTIPEAPVEVAKSGENLNLKWNNLSVSALTKPYEERATLVLK
ncbi:MAG: hypothetical protein JNK09_01170 [Prolixibacteraceae bacterium]|nr:hypothetical protein [Prolixibacteraceae bacterium]